MFSNTYETTSPTSNLIPQKITKHDIQAHGI